MALERIITKYEPIAGTDYIGNAGQLWLDMETGNLHLSDDVNAGGSLVISQAANGLLNVPTLTVSGGAELGTSFLTFPNGENASIGIVKIPAIIATVIWPPTNTPTRNTMASLNFEMRFRRDAGIMR